VGYDGGETVRRHNPAFLANCKNDARRPDARGRAFLARVTGAWLDLVKRRAARVPRPF
jgi:hypothetical protein